MKKKCAHCAKKLPMVYFGNSKAAKDGKRHICRACTSIANQSTDNRKMSKQEKLFLLGVAG